MSSLNKKPSFYSPPLFPAYTSRTHEGGLANQKVTPYEQLERTCMSCLLWEDNFYENGESVSDRIRRLCNEVSFIELVKLIKKTKNESKLRHTPLFLLVQLIKNINYFKFLISKTNNGKSIENIDFESKNYVLNNDLSNLIGETITRVDDITEILSIYWNENSDKNTVRADQLGQIKKAPISNQLRKGLDMAFRKFDEYQLAKYNRTKEIKLKDIMRLIRPTPSNDQQSAMWKRLINNELATPDTWEVAISAAGNDEGKKKDAFIRLIKEHKLGDLAFLRNLRLMEELGVPRDIIRESFNDRKFGMILPTQFLVSAKHSITFINELEKGMFDSMSNKTKIKQKIRLLVDRSGSMNDPLSSKSETTRYDVATALVILLKELCDDVDIYLFDQNAYKIPSYKGFALKELMGRANGGTQMWKCHDDIVNQDNRQGNIRDLTIIITDEQTSDHQRRHVTIPTVIVNVAAYEHGVNYSKNIIQVNGWSYNIIEFIQTAIIENYFQ